MTYDALILFPYYRLINSSLALAPTRAFVGRATSGTVVSRQQHSMGCLCPSCLSGAHPTGCACAACNVRTHPASCGCVSCSARRGTALFADVAEAEAETEAEPEVPAEVAALDGIESEEEAHNAERPARQNLQKKKRTPKGKEISELEVGSTVSGKVRTITAYGAFVDIGAQTDGLLHISQLASGFVANVNDVLKEGQEIEVRIVNVDTKKNQVALSLMSEEEAEAASQPRQRERPQRQQRQSRRDDSAVQKALAEKGWDSSAFVEGTVVSTVDFGCFVRIDTSLLNSECEGELDGLVHISALGTGRVGSVTDVVNVDDKVQVRVKSIAGNKVSLTMLSADQEDEKQEARGPGAASGPEPEGAKDWKDIVGKMQADAPTFTNRPLVDDRRS